jgi:hypothetical protein
MEKESVPRETVQEWQAASAKIRGNVKRQTEARLEVVSSTKRQKVFISNRRLHGLELTGVGKGRKAEIEKERD